MLLGWGHNDDLLSDPEFLIRLECWCLAQQTNSCTWEIHNVWWDLKHDEIMRSFICWQRNSRHAEAYTSILSATSLPPRWCLWSDVTSTCETCEMHQDAPRTTISLHSECPKRPVWVPSWSHLFQFKDPVQLFVFEVCLKALAEDIDIEGIDMACHGFSKNQGSPKCQFYWEKTDQPWDPGVHISRQPNMVHLWEPEEDMGCLEMEYTLKLHKIASSIWNINDKLW